MTEPFDTIDAMRRRPAMFVGDVHEGSGLVHLMWELVGNSLDEYLAGFCQTIAITLHDNLSATVEDDGRGIPVDALADGLPFLESIFTRWHDRPTFDGHAKHLHVGVHGVGAVLVNALSSHTRVETVRGDRLFRQDFKAGFALGGVEDLGPTTRRGTKVTFAPDASVFTNREFDATEIRDRLQSVAALCPGLVFHFHDERRARISFPGGITDLLELETRKGVGPALPEKPLRASGESDNVRVDVVFQWLEKPWSAKVRSFVNLNETHEGGTHVTGLKRALRELLVVTGTPTKEDERLARDLQERLIGVISVFHHDPQFGGPTKALLKSPEVRPIVERVVRKCLHEFATERREEALRVVGGMRS